jgi:hypothetical protein
MNINGTPKVYKGYCDINTKIGIKEGIFLGFNQKNRARKDLTLSFDFFGVGHLKDERKSI